MPEKTVEQRVQFIEKVFYVVGALAVIFGVSGAWGLSLLKSARAEINELQAQVVEQRKNAAALREAMAPIQEFVDKSKTQVDLVKAEIDKAAGAAVTQIQPKIEERVEAILRARTSPTASVAAVRDITSLGVHNELTIQAKRGDLIAASYSGSARSSEFYYTLVSPNNSATAIAPQGDATQVVQLASQPWRSISANQLFRATRDGEIKLAVEYSRSDVSGAVKVFGSILVAHVVR
jgi:hypothetical protein